MAQQRTYRAGWDRVGMTASLLCAIHCALVPLVLSFSVLSGISFLTSWVWEFVFIGASVLIALYALLNGYLKHHGDVNPLIVATIGLAIIILAHLSLELSWAHAFSVIGGLLVAFSHYLNYKACNKCSKCRD